MKSKLKTISNICLLLGTVAIATITPIATISVINTQHNKTNNNKELQEPNSLGLQPQFNIVNLPDDDKWNSATLGMAGMEPGQYIPGETDTNWSLSINKDYYTASFSVVNEDSFLNKYGENNYITLKDCVNTGMINQDFKFGFLYHNSFGGSDIASINLKESKYNFETNMVGWAQTPKDDYSTFVWKKNLNTSELNPLLSENNFSISLILTLYDQNNNKASVYDAFQTALIPDGMDEMFSLKIKDGYYFKWTGQYDFATITTQTFDDWTFNGAKTEVRDRISPTPVEQQFGEIVKPTWMSPTNNPNFPDSSSDLMYATNDYGKQYGIWGIIQRCQLGEDIKKDGYVIKTVRLADLIGGSRADGSSSERASTDAWISHYDVKMNLIPFITGDTNLPIPWVSEDNNRQFWLNIPDFHNRVLFFDPLNGFSGTVDFYNKTTGNLDYQISLTIGSQLGA